MTTLLERPAATRRLEFARQAFRTLLVHVQPSPAGDARLQAAVALAHHLDATLVGLGAELLQTPIGDPIGGVDPAWLMELRHQLEADLDAAGRAFAAAAEGIDSCWSAAPEPPVAAVAAASRTADLIVAGGVPAAYGEAWRACDTAELVLRSGRPVIVVPPSGGRLVADAVVVGWKDSREARRALADSLPFLKGAREVLVQEICNADGRAGADARTTSVVEGLLRHGVNARGRAVVTAPEDVAGALRRGALEIGADLIVAGCYGRSRLGEWLFGGATRDLLHMQDTFLLLSH